MHSLKHMDEGESDSIWGMGVGGLYRAYRLMEGLGYLGRKFEPLEGLEQRTNGI